MLLDGTELAFTPAAPSTTDAASAPSHTHAWKDGGSFSFHDVLDTLNPLQHIPVVGTLYRWATGDQPGNVARIVGDGLYGGPIGLAAGLLSVAVKEETGEDPGQMVVAALTGSGEDAASSTAENSAPAPAAEAAQSPAPLKTAAATPAPSSSPAPPAAAPASASSSSGARPLPLPGGAPMSLFRSMPTPATAAPPGTGPAEQAFLTRNAALQRTAFGAHGNTPTRTFTAPIPLQLTGSALPSMPRPMPAPPRPAAPVPAAAPATIPAAMAVPAAASAAAPAAAGDPAAQSLLQHGPVDVPQRMIDALDKYMKLQKQQELRGSAIDMSN